MRPCTTRFTRTRHSDIVHPVSSSQLTEARDRVRSFGGYNKRILSRAERRRCNDQFRQVAKRSIEQPARSVARLFRNRFGGVTKQACKRHDREY
jgi:hypothetical protein